MLYNTTYRRTKRLAEPSQEDIYNCPHYFGMSLEQVKASGAPQFLMSILDQFPWDGRRTVLQIRPQDFRTARPKIDGNPWHCDDNVRLLHGDAACSSIDDFHLMVISFGNACATEFIKTPMELPDFTTAGHHATYQVFNQRLTQPFEIEASMDGQMIEYTSIDFHRASPDYTLGSMRLMIVAFNCDNIEGNVRVLPSIREQEQC